MQETPLSKHSILLRKTTPCTKIMHLFLLTEHTHDTPKKCGESMLYSQYAWASREEQSKLFTIVLHRGLHSSAVFSLSFDQK